jgi:drug/metabolite transporter (DMT)-like permease
VETPNLDSRQALIGSAFIVLAAIGFSSKSVLIKLAYADSAQIDAITLMTLRMTLALPFFLAVALWNRESVTIERRPRDWIALVLLGVTGYYLASLLDFTGLEYISAGLERLILFLYPTIVVLLTAFIYRRPVGKPQRWALLLSYTGILLVFGDNPDAAYPDIALGAALVFASAVVFALFMTGSGHFIPRFGSRRFTAYSMSIACVVTGAHFAASKPMGQLVVSSEVFALALMLALFSTVAPAFLMNAGIHRVGASQASILSTVGPVATLALAYGLLDEILRPIQLIGSALVLGGVLLVSLAKWTPGRLRTSPSEQS